MAAMKDVMGMVLAAGLGTRLRPLTDKVPKAMVPVAGLPMISYALGWLSSQGIREVIVNTHYLGKVLEAGLGDGSSHGVRITYSRETELLGTGGGVGRARKFFGRSRLVLINADTLLDVDLEAMLANHEAGGASASMAVVPARDPDEYTPLIIGTDGLVKSIGGLPGPNGNEENRRMAHFIGLSILDPEAVDYLPGNSFASLTTDALIPAIIDGKKIAAHEHAGYWKALDAAERISEAEADIAAGRFAPAKIG